jgi:hypothetical protein
MAYQGPNKKKLDWLRKREQERQLEAELAVQIEACYERHTTGQERYLEELPTWSGLADELGIDLSPSLLLLAS